MENLDYSKKAVIYKNIFSSEEINKLINFYNSQPFVPMEDYHYRDKEKKIIKQKCKNPEYYPGIPPYKVLHKKLKNLIGDHTLNHGSYNDGYYPFGLHTDTNTTQSNDGITLSTVTKNIAVLIPLSQHESCKTIFFNFFADEFEKHTIVKTDQSYAVDQSLYGHCSDWGKEKLKFLEVDKIFNWKLGDIATWPRNQLHCAGNFLGKIEYKSFVTLFV